MGTLKIFLPTTRIPSHLVKLSLPNIYFLCHSSGWDALSAVANCELPEKWWDSAREIVSLCTRMFAMGWRRRGGRQWSYWRCKKYIISGVYPAFFFKNHLLQKRHDKVSLSYEVKSQNCLSVLVGMLLIVTFWRRTLTRIYLVVWYCWQGVNNCLFFQELLELAQRKFLRQVSNYADENDQVYPRLLLLDFVSMIKESGTVFETDSFLVVGWRRLYFNVMDISANLAMFVR